MLFTTGKHTERNRPDWAYEFPDRPDRTEHPTLPDRSCRPRLISTMSRDIADVVYGQPLKWDAEAQA